MSKDIRSFFLSTKKSKLEDSVPSTKAKKRSVVQISSDEDEVKEKTPAKRQKLSKKTNRAHVLSDSEDEVREVPKHSNKSKSSPNEDKPKKKVSVADMFASAPVKRVEGPKISRNLQKEEAKFHSDDEFEATLNQLDTSEIEKEYLNSLDKDGNSGKKRSNDGVIQSSDQKKHKSDNDSHTELKTDVKSIDSKKKRHNSNESKHKHHKQKIDKRDDDKLQKDCSGNNDVESESKREHKKKNKLSTSSGDGEIDANRKSASKKVEEVSAREKKSSSSSNEDKSGRNSSRDKHRNEENASSSKHGKKLNLHKLKKKSEEGVSEMTVEKKVVKKETHADEKELDPFEERIQKKKQSSELYQQYLHRGGARNPGSKEIPEGAANCLAGLSFLITGVLDSLEREEADELIKKYGGRILHSVSKKTDYVILGDEPGPAKLQKAITLGIKRISEDELLELIRTRNAGKANKIIPSHAKSKTPIRERKKSPEPDPIEPVLSPIKDQTKSEVEVEVKSVEKAKSSVTNKVGIKPENSSETLKVPDTNGKSTSDSVNQLSENLGKGDTQALVDKYRPKTMKQIVGQQGDKSNAKKLYTWLKNWHKNRDVNLKHTKPSPWAKNDDGGFFKAVLLSGPPGVGKTTTVEVVCKELGIDPLEFNASDTRSKRLLKEEVSELLSNTTMKSYFFGDHREKPSANHALIMDEVDGMAGNEDRGGLQELIALIKSTHIPIICICNDRNNPKMRTLANYTFDLRFQKPKIEQIRAAMMSMCFREGITISKEDLGRLIEATNQDIRQVINHLALLSANPDHKDETKGKMSSKDLRLGPWDVVKRVFSAEEHKKMSIHDKSDLFFHDYSIAPLFVQENYLSVIPSAPKNELLERVAQTAESLAMGDLIENSIRSKGAWSLLPMQACYSSVIPGSTMSGHITSQINFPAWLGRNSRRGKFDRLLQEITVHSRLATSASKEAINLDYLTYLRDAVVRPLAMNGTNGAEEALSVMNDYHLLREDLDSLVEVSLWPGQRDPMQAVESKVKAAFTRSYNKSSIMTPYATSRVPTKKKTGQASQDEGFMDGDDEELENEVEEDNVSADAMIKANKPAANKAAASTSKTSEAGTSKRGKGRGKAKLSK